MRYTMGFLFSKDKNRVALIHKRKPEFLKGLFNGIGGKIEDNETAHECMVREFKEETGVDIPEWTEFCVLQGNWGEMFIFKAFGDLIDSVKTMESEQIVIVDLHLLNTLMNEGKTLSNLKWIIPMALDKDNIQAHTIERI